MNLDGALDHGVGRIGVHHVEHRMDDPLAADPKAAKTLVEELD